MDKYHMDFVLPRAKFEKVAADLTGLTPKSVNSMIKIERNRTESGKFLKGYRYRVTSVRSGVEVTALKETK